LDIQCVVPSRNTTSFESSMWQVGKSQFSYNNKS
jgi:hypothetical protein